MTESLVLSAIEDGVATLTLNRPQARNALSVALMSALELDLQRVMADAAVAVVVIAAAGPAFCAGHDLKELRGADEAGLAAIFHQCARLMQDVVRAPKPVIAKVHAMATAAGCQLVASCDLALAAEGAHFATPGVNIGLFCSTPMVALTRAVGRKAAMEMLLLGESIDAATAQRLGLVNRVVPAERLDAETTALAAKIAAKSPKALAIGKQAFYAQADMDLDDAYAYAADVMVRNMATHDAAEGIDAFLAKRPPIWRGC